MQPLEVDRAPRRHLVVGGELVERQEHAHQLGAALARHGHAEEAEVDHRVAEVGAFPIEHRDHLPAVPDQVPHTEVAVHDHGVAAGDRRQPLVEPEPGVAQHRLRGPRRRHEMVDAVHEPVDVRSHVLSGSPVAVEHP